MAMLYYMAWRLLHNQLRERQREARMLSSELRRLVPGLADGSVLTCRLNRVDMFMTFDKKQARMAGMPREKWTVDSFRKILHSDCTNVFDIWINQYTQLHRPVIRRLRFHLTFDEGRTYHWWELLYCLDDGSVNDKWLDGLLVNIDAVKDIENAIEDSHKKVYKVEMQESLLAAINHDLRTPLNAIAGFATLLTQQYDEFSEKERAEFSEIVRSNSELMLFLVERLKNMDDKEIAELGYKALPKSVTELLNFCYNTNRIICPSHLSFELELPQDIQDKIISIDSKRIERVINNFISNAFKFTPVGKVTLGWKYIAGSDEVEIYVSDTGIGISKENQGKVFEEYLKINEHAHGTGLGLNICKRIVLKHGGKIGLVSEKDKGSTFYCRFKTI